MQIDQQTAPTREPNPDVSADGAGRRARKSLSRGRIVIRRVFLLALLALFSAGAWQAWRLYDFSKAQEEARALGLAWEYKDPIEAIRANWKAAFNWETWNSPRIFGSALSKLDAHPGLLERLAPDELNISLYEEMGSHHRDDLSQIPRLPSVKKLHIGGSSLKSFSGIERLQNLRALSSSHGTCQFGSPLDVSTLGRCRSLEVITIAYGWYVESLDGFENLTKLRELRLGSCKGTLKSIDALKGLTSLRVLELQPSAVPNLDALAKLTSLEELDLFYFSRCTDISVLRGLPALRTLKLMGMPECKNLEVLSHLTQLNWLELAEVPLENADLFANLSNLTVLGLRDCLSVTNLDGVKGLKKLEAIVIMGRHGLSTETVAALRREMPSKFGFEP